jgi:hypothetical protein
LTDLDLPGQEASMPQLPVALAYLKTQADAAVLDMCRNPVVLVTQGEIGGLALFFLPNGMGSLMIENVAQAGTVYQAHAG